MNEILERRENKTIIVEANQNIVLRISRSILVDEEERKCRKSKPPADTTPIHEKNSPQQ